MTFHVSCLLWLLTSFLPLPHLRWYARQNTYSQPYHKLFGQCLNLGFVQYLTFGAQLITIQGATLDTWAHNILKPYKFKKIDITMYIMLAIPLHTT